MNTLLQKLFDTYKVSPKNRHDIEQIYGLMPVHKKNNLLNNFEALAYRLEKIEKSIAIERDILIWDIMTDLEQAVETERRKRIIFQNKNTWQNVAQTLKH